MPDLEKISPSMVDCYYLDYDGLRFGPVQQQFAIQSFGGLKAVISLEAYPLRFGSQEALSEEALTTRGKSYIACTMVSHRYYRGREPYRYPLRPSGEKIESKNHRMHAEDIDSRYLGF